MTDGKGKGLRETRMSRDMYFEPQFQSKIYFYSAFKEEARKSDDKKIASNTESREKF